MSKQSTTKLAVAPMPPKIRLNRHAKDSLLEYMMRQFDLRIDDTELNATLDSLMTRINAMLRAKYPEDDMVVLRKYKVTHLDKCLRFTLPETGRVFMVRFDNPNHTEGRLADIPCLGGCYTNEIFASDKDFETLADRWDKQTDARKALVSQKRQEYYGFIEACRYLEEVEAIIPLTEEVRKAMGVQGRSLTIINPEILSRIKSDFAQGMAA